MAFRVLRKFVIAGSAKRSLTFSVCKTWKIQTAGYAAKKAGSAPTSKKKQLQVETDPNLLCARLCGGNIYKEGEDPILGPDEEYPDWLWKLKTDPKPVPLEELSEDDPRYWRRLKKLTTRNNLKMRYVKKV